MVLKLMAALALTLTAAGLPADPTSTATPAADAVAPPAAAGSQRIPFVLKPGIELPKLDNFNPLPDADPEFSAQIDALVKETGLDVMTPAADNQDGEDEWSSICIVDLRDRDKPRVASWKAVNFIYPASTYKMYVIGEAIREVVAGEHKLDDVLTVSEKNWRKDSKLVSGEKTTLSEILRLTAQYSDNTAANIAIDTVDRQKATALMWALGCKGSEITRKFLGRDSEDEGYANIVSTTSCALHQATFLWAVESGAIGGGKGRGLIKAYLSMCESDYDRNRKALPDSATLFSKTGEWENFTTEASIVEDGDTRYIIAVMTAQPRETVAPKMVAFATKVHELMKQQVVMKKD
ncbi:hypothetical protein BH09SUM1_BH09SUM1_30850 [soil metagenome]